MRMKVAFPRCRTRLTVAEVDRKRLLVKSRVFPGVSEEGDSRIRTPPPRRVPRWKGDEVAVEQIVAGKSDRREASRTQGDGTGRACKGSEQAGEERAQRTVAEAPRAWPSEETACTKACTVRCSAAETVCLEF